ncbi:FAD-dependent oxidoreductase [Nakamurella sp. PAMC28650]|uniref:FAD-dependent oxidoreductase n=1 Tax=Nakamurella sp. PAMC28650 TaxID=2762325 RepID=UPI001C9A9D4B|nr:FAD-dependent oxidoreductase [Nakamurella sp. PAMC28650]
MGTSEYVVIGAGLAGSATAWNLARRGHEVTLVERTRPAAPDGSSHGSARIFRYAYPDAFYAALVASARSRWEELEQLAGRRLITPTGSLDFGESRNPSQLAGVLEAVGVEHELLAAAAARARWPQIAVDTEVLWHPEAGVIDAQESVNAMVDLARRAGAEILTDWPVTVVQATATGYRVLSPDGEPLDCAKVVVSAGGWLPQLLGSLPLPADFRESVPPLQVRQEQAYHFPYRESAAEPGPAEADPRPWPTVIHKNPGISTYSLPGGRDAAFRGQKLAEYNAGRIISGAAAQTGTVDAANRARMVDYAIRYLPGVVPEPYAETTCLFTNTPTEDFIIDEWDGITLLSPCSGHGAKFAPLLGEIAADLATGVRAPAERFRLRSRAR